jgi:hypothetical protein
VICVTLVIVVICALCSSGELVISDLCIGAYINV